ncbi:hypothetical protein Tco_0169711 [Tanacetum coccineum]
MLKVKEVQEKWKDEDKENDEVTTLSELSCSFSVYSTKKKHNEEVLKEMFESIEEAKSERIAEEKVTNEALIKNFNDIKAKNKREETVKIPPKGEEIKQESKEEDKKRDKRKENTRKRKHGTKKKIKTRKKNDSNEETSQIIYLTVEKEE